MAILLIIVCIAALLGFVFVKCDELSGIGEPTKRSAFRFQHGSLVRATPKTELSGSRDCMRDYLKTLPWVTTGLFVAAFIVGTCVGYATQVAWLANSALPAFIIAGEACIRCPTGKASFTLYLVALVASVVPALICTYVLLAVMGSLSGIHLVYGIVSALLYMLGAAVIALCPQKVEFEREFEDGAKRSITVSQGSTAYKAYLALENKERK